MVSFYISALATAFISFSHSARAGPYDGYTTTALIPFLEAGSTGVSWTDKVHVKVRFAPTTTSRSYQPFVDTGTCGIVFSAADIPEWTPADIGTYPRGWQFLSSSKRLYTGNWIPKDVYFNYGDSAHQLVKSQVSILAVTAVTNCTDYDITRDTDSCDMVPAPTVTAMPTGIRIMGVGFGREADGQPQGTPDKNPLLNIKEIGSVGVSAYRSGYIITKEGLTVGLTNGNWAGMVSTQLPTRSTMLYDWASLPACISVDSAPCTPGYALLDTGIDQAYLTVPTSVTLRRNGYLLIDGSDVRIQLGQPAAAEESFVVGTGIDLGVTPAMVYGYRRNDREPHINTGRHVYRAWNVGYDAVAGKLGFKSV